MSGSPWSEEDLARIRARDPETLNAFFEAYFDRAYGYVVRLVGDAHTAEDLTQTAFLKMHRAIHDLDSDRDPAAWVFAVVANTVRDHWRSRGHRDGARTGGLEPEEVVQPYTPHHEQEAADAVFALNRALAKLSENLRAVVLLRDHQDLGYEEVARALGITEAAARKRHSRAQAELKQAMQAIDSIAPQRQEP